MPFSIRPSRFHLALVGIFCLVASLSLSTFVQAETKTIISEATYIMGDGETPDFAEARALQKAKQAALEEAGTYVQSYTKVQNLDLTTEEIQTIAGGVLQVEVLEKTRSLVTDGLRVYTKIRATVTTDKMEELAHRIKGENVTEEYIKLQAEYARLSRELESWKQRAARTPQGLERKAALDQIQKGEKAFARVQQREADLFQRLVSGKQLVKQASYDIEIIDELLQTILTSGYIVTVGDIQAVADPEKPNTLVLKVPLTIRVSETVQEALSHAVNALGGTMRSNVKGDFRPPRVPGEDNMYASLQIQTKMRENVTISLVRIGKHPETAKYFQDEISKVALLVTFLNGTSELSHCLLGHRPRGVKGLDEGTGYEDLRWIGLRRIFPIYSTFFPDSKTAKIDNGKYEEHPGQGPRDGDYGYVAMVRDEATFVIHHWLPPKTVKNMTGVSVRAISLDKSYYDAPHKDPLLKCDTPSS